MAPVVSAPIAQKAGSGTKWAIVTAVGYFGTDNLLGSPTTTTLKRYDCQGQLVWLSLEGDRLV